MSTQKKGKDQLFEKTRGVRQIRIHLGRMKTELVWEGKYDEYGVHQ